MSPNYLGTDKEEQETEPRIGEAYQAKIPKFRKNKVNAQLQYGKEGILIWCPKEESNDDVEKKQELEVTQFLEAATKSSGFDIHAALGVLYWFGHDIAKAQGCLKKLLPGKFNAEEEDQFNQAVLTGNKEQRMDILKDRLPNRSYKEVVARYYQWRASRKTQSLMDTKVEDVEQRIKVESDEVEARVVAAREAEEDDGLPPPSHRNYLRMADELGDDMSLEDDDEPEDPISIVRKKVLEEDLKEPRFTAKISKDELDDALHRRRTKQTSEPTEVNTRDSEVAKYKSEVQLAKQICSRVIIPLKLEAPPSIDDLNSYIEALRISNSKPDAAATDVKCEKEVGG